MNDMWSDVFPAVLARGQSDQNAMHLAVYSILYKDRHNYPLLINQDAYLCINRVQFTSLLSVWWPRVRGIRWCTTTKLKLCQSVLKVN